MAYSDDVLALSPQHLWPFDGNYVDVVGSVADGTNAGFGTAAVLCEDASNSVECNGTSDRVQIPATTDIDGATNAKGVGGWVRFNSIQLPPKSIYREGTTGNQFNVTLWAGNKLMLDVANGGDIRQAFSNNVLKPNRVYHIFGKIEGSGQDNEFALFVDGIRQSVTEPSNGQTGFASLGVRARAEFGDPSGATQAGGGTVLLNGPTNCRYNYWASFTGTEASNLTDAQIREELFEKGALPGVTITNQAGLDALASTARPDEPLNIRVEDNGGDLTLTADNVTHDPLASIHVQWLGTGTLTYINTNGSNASIGSTPNGGTINFINPAVLTIAPLIAGSEVRVYESGTINEINGIETSGTSFSTAVQVSSVDAVIIKIDYEYIRVNNIDMTGGDVSLPVSQQFDRNYRNP